MAAISGIGGATQNDNINRAPRFDQARPVKRLSTDSDGQEAKGDSFDPALSDDGNSLVFASDAHNLVADDTNGVRDIFVKDLTTGTVTRISTDADGAQADRASDGLYEPISRSADGTRVVFVSEARNLVPGDTNSTGDIFLKDIRSGAVTRIDVEADGTQTPRGSSNSEPVISRDGTQVAYVSNARNLVPGDTNGARDIFLRNLATNVVTRVNTAADGTQTESGSDSSDPVFSPDGTQVAFVSDARNLVPGKTTSASDIFVKDLATGAVTWVSIAADGTEADGESASPVFSPDGTKVAFVSKASNLVADDTNGTPDIFVKDLNTQVVTRVSTGSNREQLHLGGDLVPTFSPDGTKIAFVDSVSKQAYVKDLNTDALTAIAPVPNASQTQYAAFSHDGSELIFVSEDSTLVPGDTNRALDIFEAWTGQTTTGFVQDRADRVASGTSGKLGFTDPDAGDTHTIAITPADGTVGTLIARIDREAGSATGVIAWDYTVDHAAVAGLAKGQTKVESFTVTLDDGHGGTADQVVTVTVLADNDAPRIDGSVRTATGVVQDRADQTAVGTSGALSFTDADLGDSHTVAVKPGDGAVGTLTAAISQEPGAAPGTIAWTYAVDHAALGPLTNGHGKVETFNVTLDDGHGGTSDQVVTITVVAENHAPQIDGTDQSATGSVQDRADQTAVGTSGALSFTDADLGDSHTVAVKPGEGAVGTLTAAIDKEPGAEPGTITWTYSVDHAAIETLASDQTKVERFTVTLDDGYGGTADQVVTVTIRGSATPSAAAAGDPSVSDADPGAVQNPADPDGTTGPGPDAQPSAYTTHVVAAYREYA